MLVSEIPVAPGSPEFHVLFTGFVLYICHGCHSIMDTLVHAVDPLKANSLHTSSSSEPSSVLMELIMTCSIVRFVHIPAQQQLLLRTVWNPCSVEQ